MTKRRRKVSLLLAVFLIIMQIPSISLAEDLNEFLNKNGIKGYLNVDVDILGGPIKEGASFELQFTLDNRYVKEADEVNIQDIHLKFEDNSSFKLVNPTGENKKIVSLKSGETESFKIGYIYTGRGAADSIQVTGSYRLDGYDKDIKIEETIRVANIEKPKEEPRPEPEKPKEGKPNIVLAGNKTIMANAGETVDLDIVISNSSKYRAQDITTSINIGGEGSGIFVLGAGSKTTSSLRQGEDTRLTYKLSIDKSVKDGSYPINVNNSYFNMDGEAGSTEDSVYIKVSNEGNDLQLVVEDLIIDADKEIQAGDSFRIVFKVKNLSKLPAKDVKLSISGLEGDKFSLLTGTNSSIRPKIGANETASFIFPVRASKKISPGSHELGLTMEYKSLFGGKIEEESKFFIPVKGGSLQNSSLIIENIKSPLSIGPNQTALVSFNLRNRGQNQAKNVIIKATSGDEGGLIPRSVSTIKLDSLAPGENKKLDFSFFASKDTPTKNYPITISVEYEDDFITEGEKYGLEQFIGIFVDNPQSDGEAGDGNKSTPKLIIDKYSFSSDMVEAGQNFDMKLSFYNTNRNKTVRNIKIFLTAEQNVSESADAAPSSGSVFTPVNSSNTFYIDSIPPKGRVEKTITMFTIPDAAAKTHMITANFEYEDGEFEEFKATELIGVPVVQKSKLEISELNYMRDTFLGDMVSISSEFYNTGKSTLYNMMVRLEGDFDVENGSYYVGNFAPGTSEYFDGTIIPTKLGESKGELIFSFEDSTGEKQEIRSPFSINVEEGFVDEFPDDFDMPEEKTWKDKLKWPLIILALAGLGFSGFKFYKKKKAEKEEEDLLSDE